jgi:hypothetical protein
VHSTGEEVTLIQRVTKLEEQVAMLLQERGKGEVIDDAELVEWLQTQFYIEFWQDTEGKKQFRYAKTNFLSNRKPRSTLYLIDLGNLTIKKYE